MNKSRWVMRLVHQNAMYTELAVGCCAHSQQGVAEFWENQAVFKAARSCWCA